jgi:hypothetical protein
MIHLPKPTISFVDLPSDPKQRHEAFVDAFGQYFFWIREETLYDTRQLVESADTRTEIGRLFRSAYERASILNGNDRETAFGLVEAAIDWFARLFLEMMADSGAENPVGSQYGLRFRLDVEICDAGATDHIIMAETINQGGTRLFPTYWGRWLNRFGKKPPKEL